MTDISLSPPLTPIEIGEKILRLQEVEKEIKERMSVLRQELLQKMQETGVKRFDTQTFSITTASRRTLKVLSHSELQHALEEREVPVQMKTVVDMDVMKPAIEALIDQGLEMEGLEVQETTYPMIRVTKP